MKEGITMIRNKILMVSLCFLFGFTVGCESEEDDLLAQAQACLNENVDNPSGLAGCKKFLSGINTQQSRQIGCSIEFGVAGMTQARIIAAFEVIDDEAAVANKEAKFMTLFSLNSVAAADQLVSVCTNTGSEGLEFIAVSYTHLTLPTKA